MTSASGSSVPQPFEAILFRAKTADDPYEDQLRQLGCLHVAHVPVLEFTHPPQALAKLRTLLDQAAYDKEFSCIVVTSAQAIKSCVLALCDQKADTEQSVNKATQTALFRSLDIPVFCVGEKTYQAARDAGLKTAFMPPEGEGHGTADDLLVWIAYYLDLVGRTSVGEYEWQSILESTNTSIAETKLAEFDCPPRGTKPVLFLNAETRVNSLPESLKTYHIPFRELHVYQSVPRSHNELLSELIPILLKGPMLSQTESETMAKAEAPAQCLSESQSCSPFESASRQVLSDSQPESESELKSESKSSVPLVLGFFSPSGVRTVVSALHHALKAEAETQSPTTRVRLRSALVDSILVSIGTTTHQAVMHVGNPICPCGDEQCVWNHRDRTHDRASSQPRPASFALACASAVESKRNVQ